MFDGPEFNAPLEEWQAWLNELKQHPLGTPGVADALALAENMVELKLSELAPTAA